MTLGEPKPRGCNPWALYRRCSTPGNLRLGRLQDLLAVVVLNKGDDPEALQAERRLVAEERQFLAASVR